MALLQEKAWARMTAATYRTQLQCYLEFAQLLNKCAVPVSNDVLLFYVIYLVKVRKFTFASVRQYLNTVTHIKLFPDPVDGNNHLNNLLRGIKRELGAAQTPVDAITQSLLSRIQTTMNIKTMEDLSFWCACLIAFYRLLRPNNITSRDAFDSTTDLCRTDLTYCAWGYLLTLRHTKTIQFREREVTVCLPKTYTSNALCPAVQAYLGVTVSADPLGPLSLMQNGRALTYNCFSQKSSTALSQTGVVNYNIRGHSLRRGGACWLSKLGVSLEDIKSVGYWSSSAVHRYIDPDFRRQLSIVQQFGKTLCV